MGFNSGFKGLIVTFHNFVNAPKNSWSQYSDCMCITNTQLNPAGTQFVY